ncbi:UPF0481 protein At3g47200-like [Oryza brachyantha]|uniref:UPF0481 protein At3g47200-like n=1 Tax=Oryza brachyantha TaxID=4533 RepID=UPI000776650F|nr:UPF0481 protein At3g47200-like [Oryza brachyantha]
MTNPKAYRLQLVSLGPFHHGEPALQPMEAHKRRAVEGLNGCRVERGRVEAPLSPPAMANSSGSCVVDIDKTLAENENGSEPPASGEAAARPQRERHSIYRVPEYMKKMTNPDAYQPQLVALGPFHHGEPALQPMEAHKRRAVEGLVNRCGKPKEEFLAAVEEIAEQLRDAYEDLDEEWRGERFVELMVTDGCFLLEITMMFLLGGDINGYEPEDPVYSRHGCLYLDTVISDMLVIENQLPLLLLQKLTFVAGPETFPDEDGDIHRQVIQLLLADTITPTTPVNDIGVHALDVLQKIISGTCQNLEGSVEGSPHRSKSSTELQPLAGDLDVRSDQHVKQYDHSTPSPRMRTAAELHEAGIHFKVSTGFGFADTVSFKGRVLHVPKIRLYDNAERMFLNLMAFERLHPGAGNDVNSFVWFMDELINTAKDVRLLKSKGIIEHGLGSDKAVADLINKTLTKGAVMGSYSLNEVIKEVDAYCKKPWNRWRADLIHTYFNNPWVFISLVAATTLVITALIQTIYSALSFNKKS